MKPLTAVEDFTLRGAQPDDETVARGIRRSIEAYAREDHTMAFGWSFGLALGMVADAVSEALHERDEIVANVTLVLSADFADLPTGTFGRVEEPLLTDALVEHGEVLLGAARNLFVVASDHAPRSLLRWDSVEGDRAVIVLPGVIEPPADPMDHARRRA